MAVIHIGLIGCGGISRAHSRGYRDLPDLFDVVAVCDANETAARERGAELGAKHVFTDHRALLNAHLVDAVDLCLPHHLHAPVALDALAAGMHVLVEKPLANTLEDADRMVEAAQRAGKILMVGHNQRYDPQYAEMKRLVESGLLGTIFCARADHNQNFRRSDVHWLKSNAAAGGGVLIGSGIHRVDLLRWLVSEITEVYNVQVTQPDRLEGEACSLSTFRFANGAVGELASNWAVRRSPWHELMWLYGTEGNVHNATAGMLQLDSERDPETTEGYRRLELPTKFSFTEELRHYGECIRDGQQPLTSGEEGRQTLAVVLAAYESARTNRPVVVERRWGATPPRREATRR